MTKLIKKKDCKFKNCQIVKGDELIGIPRVVWMQLNKLELMFQQYRYLGSQLPGRPGPSLDGFVRESMLDGSMPYIDMPDTPVTDARVEEAMEFMAEIDAVEATTQANQMIDRFKDLVLWCKGKKFVEGDCYDPIDTPALGNPLDLTPKAIAQILHVMAESPVVIEV